MKNSRMWVGIAVAALGVAATAVPASAQPAYYPAGAYAGQPSYDATGRPLTVQRRYAQPVAVAPAYDPYSGPKAVITAPIATAGTIAALPFRVVNAVFPAHGDPSQNPLVLIGAPVHVAGEIVQVPFRLMQAPFGGASYVPY